MTTNDQPHAEVTPETNELCFQIYHSIRDFDGDMTDAQNLLADFVSKREVAAIASCTEEEAAAGDHNLVPSLQAEISALTAKVVKLTERAEKAEAALLDIKQRVTADEDFSADEIIELINGLLGRYAMSKAWFMEAAHKETMDERDDLRELATRLAEVHGEVSDAIDGAEQLFESAFDHPCECGSGESCRHCSLVTQGNSKIWKVEKLTEAALADARKANLLK